MPCLAVHFVEPTVKMQQCRVVILQGKEANFDS
jgi:hypothetical protein